jgi:hypothetical protein
MNKTDRLLQMMEQPQRYTADEWQEILADDECRELYTLMSKTQSAIDAARADEEVTDEMIDTEWKRLAKPYSGVPTLLKIAAIFIGVLMLSGIAFAAIHIFSHRVGGEENHVDKPMPESQTIIPSSVPVISPDTIPQPRVFENVPLDEIIAEMALYYNKVADIQNEQAHDLRLYYKWDRKDDIGSIVKDLNHFDHVNLALEGDRLTVKP